MKSTLREIIEWLICIIIAVVLYWNTNNSTTNIDDSDFKRK